MSYYATDDGKEKEDWYKDLVPNVSKFMIHGNMIDLSLLVSIS